jgi:hypothetical protein
MWQVTLEDLTLKVELIRDWPANAVKTEVRKGPTSIGTFEPEVVQLTSDYEVTSKFAGVRYTRGMRRTPVFLNRPESELRVQAPDDILRFPFTAGRYYPGQPGIFLSKQHQWSELSIRLIAVVQGTLT